MRIGRARRGLEGRLESLGQDYEAGHRSYVEVLDPGGLQWLRTKPFSAPPNHELWRCLHSFAHIVERLQLGEGAQVLDVGCGPGWLSEFLARCGYRVTGVDISEDMIRIARGRISEISDPGGGLRPVAEFHALPVREMAWEARFDAAILYDAMHHFDDELETLRVIRRTLVPGGRMYVHEGARPVPGSEGERQLIAEMKTYATLESPFDPVYLERVIAEAGFTSIRRFVELNALLDVSRPLPALRNVWKSLRAVETNTVTAMNPMPDGADGTSSFGARIETTGSWTPTRDGRELTLRLVLTNTGAGFWPASGSFPFERGVVTIGPYVTNQAGKRIELPRATLPRSVSPGKSLTLEVGIPRASVEGHAEVSIDLVREGIAWFAELGSTPAVVPLPIAPRRS